MPAQIRLPIIDWCGLEHLISRFEEIGLMHVDVARLVQFDFLEIFNPIPVRRELLQVRLWHLVVILLRIAQLHTGAGRFREFRFERHDFFGVFVARLCRRLA